MMDLDRDTLAKEEERLARALEKKRNPVIGKSAGAPSAHPEWKKHEEIRMKQYEEHKISKGREEELARVAMLQKQREEDHLKEQERTEDEFPKSDPEKREEELARLRVEEEMLNRRLYRGKVAGANAHEIEEHNKKVQAILDQNKLIAAREAAEREQQERWERECPRFEVNGPLLLGIIAEINKVRVSPKIYIKYLDSILFNFKGKTFTIPNTSVTRETQEGEVAVLELIEQLKGAPRRKMLSHSDGLSQVAYDLIRDHNKRGTIGLNFTDGSRLEDRVELYGKMTPPFEELMGYNFVNAEDLVLQWMVGDGDSQHKNRNIILNDTCTTIGISVGPNSKHKNLCVALFCSSYQDN